MREPRPLGKSSKDVWAAGDAMVPGLLTPVEHAADRECSLAWAELVLRVAERVPPRRRLPGVRVRTYAEVVQCLGWNVTRANEVLSGTESLREVSPRMESRGRILGLATQVAREEGSPARFVRQLFDCWQSLYGNGAAVYFEELVGS